jgi:hypothetical protein
MQRKLPQTYLVRPAYQDNQHSDGSEWVVILRESDFRLGLVRKDLDALAPSADEPWQAAIYTLRREPLATVGWARTRQEAVDLLALEYARRQAETEAHAVANVMAQAVIDADYEAQRQQRGSSLHACLSMPENVGSFAGPLDDNAEGLADMLLYGKRSLRKHLKGTSTLDLDLVRRDAFVTRMIELEVDRREAAAYAEMVKYEIARKKRQRVGIVEEALTQALSDTDALDGLVMGTPRVNLLKIGDSPLVVELHKHLVSPWKLTTSVMETLLDRVRKLEQLVAESGRD